MQTLDIPEKATFETALQTQIPSQSGISEHAQIPSQTANLGFGQILSETGCAGGQQIPPQFGISGPEPSQFAEHKICPISAPKKPFSMSKMSEDTQSPVFATDFDEESSQGVQKNQSSAHETKKGANLGFQDSVPILTHPRLVG